MIVCKDCGNAAVSRDGFCSSCGALLEWSGDEVAVAATRRPDLEMGRPRPVPLPVEPAHTGLFCSTCGVRNPEGRVFCRSCGQPLRPEPMAARPRPGWWRRLWRRLRGRKDFVAGDRPGNFRRHDATPRQSVPHRKFRLPKRVALSRFTPVLILVGLLGIGFGPARTWVTGHVFGLAKDAQAKFTEHYTSISPVGATASSASPGHGAALAIDGVSNTYWAASAKNDGTGATLTVRFASAVHIDRIGLLSGEPGAGFRADARPHDLELTTAGSAPTTVSFDDTADFQNQAVTLTNVTVLTITINDVYPGQQAHSVALCEIQFFSK